MSEFKRQLPNILTIARLVMALLCSYFAYEQDISSLIVSLVLFCLASATDYFDGYLARKWKIVSSFGKLMDPIADKFLILGVMFVFAVKGVIPLVFAVLVLIRELGLTIIRLVLAPKAILAARYSGKVKTFSQVLVLVTIYLILIYKPELRAYLSDEVLKWAIHLLILWVVVISIYSAIDFLYHNRKVVKEGLS